MSVLVWEIITRGIEPYHNIECVNILIHIKDGNRLSKPSIVRRLYSDYY